MSSYMNYYVELEKMLSKAFPAHRRDPLDLANNVDNSIFFVLDTLIYFF